MAIGLDHLVIAALLTLTVLVEIVCCLGILSMKTTLQRLHYVGPITMLAPLLVAIAIAVSKNPLSGASLKAFFIAAVLMVFGPIVSHATGRAAYERRGEDKA